MQVKNAVFGAASSAAMRVATWPHSTLTPVSVLDSAQLASAGAFAEACQ